MFQHVAVLVSFIFAIALTHVFSSASQLILARERVRFSWLLSVSMLNAALGVIINWLSLWQLGNLKHWTLGEVLLQLGWVIPNYFSCSLVAMPVSDTGSLEIPTFFERQRRVIFFAALAMSVVGGLANYLDRNNLEGWRPNDRIGTELLGLALLLAVCAVLAGWPGRAGCSGLASAACSFKTSGFFFYTLGS